MRVGNVPKGNVESWSTLSALILVSFSVPARPFGGDGLPGLGEYFAAIFVVYRALKDGVALPRATWITVAVLAVLFFPSLVIAPSIRSAAAKYGQMLFYPLAGAFIAQALARDSARFSDVNGGLARVFAKYGGILALLGVFQLLGLVVLKSDMLRALNGVKLLSSVDIGNVGLIRLNGIFQHYIYYGLALVVPVYGCSYIIMRRSGGPKYYIILVLILIALALSGSRSCLAVVLPAPLMVAFRAVREAPRSILPLGIVMALALPLGIVGGSAAYKYFDRTVSVVTGTSNAGDQRSSQQRAYLWNYAIDGAKEAPIFGHGLGYYKYFYMKNLDKFWSLYGIGEDNLTQYAGVLFDSGFLGLLGLIIATRNSFRLDIIVSQPDSFRWWLCLGLLMVAVNCLFHTVYFVRGIWVILWTVFGCADRVSSGR